MSKKPIDRTIEETIILFISLLASATMTPFAIYRFMQGQYIVALFEVIGVLVIGLYGFYVWKTRKTDIASIAVSSVILFVTISLNYMIGISILFWIYPVIFTVYFLNSVTVSALLTTPAILALLPLLIAEKPTIEIASILVTVVLTQIFGHIVSLTIKKQHTKLENLVNFDGLTGILNRRSLDERLNFLQSLYFRHKRLGSTVSSVIIFDIDNFKQINDKFGHLEGDNILINLSKSIKNTIRKTDEIYRYGGEEFVLIANGADLLKASELASKIRALICETKLSDKTVVTASFGVAEIESNESPSQWIARADKALYRAKRAGKNRVFLANTDKPEVLAKQLSKIN